MGYVHDFHGMLVGYPRDTHILWDIDGFYIYFNNIDPERASFPQEMIGVSSFLWTSSFLVTLVKPQASRGVNAFRFQAPQVRDWMPVRIEGIDT
jgi:hypothetical protein